MLILFPGDRPKIKNLRRNGVGGFLCSNFLHLGRYAPHARNKEVSSLNFFAAIYNLGQPLLEKGLSGIKNSIYSDAWVMACPEETNLTASAQACPLVPDISIQALVVFVKRQVPR